MQRKVVTSSDADFSLFEINFNELNIIVFILVNPNLLSYHTLQMDKSRDSFYSTRICSIRFQPVFTLFCSTGIC